MKCLLREIAPLLCLVCAVLGSQPESQGASLFVAYQNPGTVGVYDADSGAPINTGLASGLHFAMGEMALSGDSLFVPDYTNTAMGVGSVKQFDAATGSLLSANFIPMAGIPNAVVVSNNTLYVGYFGGGVGAFDATSGAPINSQLVMGLTETTSLALSGNNLYAVDSSKYTVGKYDATTGAPIAGFTSPAGLNHPTAVAILGSTLYIATLAADPHNITIGKYDAETGAPIDANFLSLSSTSVFDLAIDGNTLYVPEYGGNNRVDAFDAITGAPVPGFSAPHGLGPIGIAIGTSPAPEPSCAGLAAAGFAGVFGRRRRGSS